MPARKLTPEQESEVKRLYLLGYTLAEIGEKFGVSQPTIQRTIRQSKREAMHRDKLRRERSGTIPLVDRVCKWCHSIYQTNNPNQKSCGNKKCRNMISQSYYAGLIPRFSVRQLKEHCSIRGVSVESARAVGLSLEQLKRAVENDESPN